jgi:hypothetical protein
MGTSMGRISNPHALYVVLAAELVKLSEFASTALDRRRTMWKNEFDKSETALVLLFSNVTSPLWDVDVQRFVDDVEQQLDGVFVTHAVASTRYPTVADALAAARFQGATSAVVVDMSGGVVMSEEFQWPLPFTLAQSVRDRESVVHTYQTCASLREAAACA